MAEATAIDSTPSITPHLPGSDWKSMVVGSFGDFTPDDVKLKYVDFVTTVTGSNPNLTPETAWEKVQAVEKQFDYQFFGVRYADDPGRRLVVDRNKLSALSELKLASAADQHELEGLRSQFETAVHDVAQQTGDDPLDIIKNIDSALMFGIATDIREAKGILVDGPIITGFDETSDPKISNSVVLQFLKNTFGERTLRQAKLGRVIKDDEYLIYRGNSDEDIREGNELQDKGFTRWENGFLLATDKEAYLKAAMFLEKVDDPSQLKNLYKIRATAGATFGFHKIDLHSFGVEKSSDFDYLGGGVLASEEDKMRVYILGTLAHEVAHRYYPKITTEAKTQYAEIITTEVMAGRKKYVTDYVLRHEETYKTREAILQEEDMVESVRLYTTNPDYLKANYPQRYQFVQEHFSFVKEGGVIEAVQQLSTIDSAHEANISPRDELVKISKDE